MRSLRVLKVFTFVVLIFPVACNIGENQDTKNVIASLYLPDIIEVYFGKLENIDSTKAYADVGYQLSKANRDLQSSQVYVEAASLYDKAGNTDSVAILLHRAIDRGMANPRILSKFNSLDTIPETPLWEDLVIRLDSIEGELKNISHYSVEMGSVLAFWPYFERALADTTKAREALKEFIFEAPLEVREYYFVRYGNLDMMYGQMINAAPEYYRYLKGRLHRDSLVALNKTTTEWMHRFKELYPKAVFPKVYMVPGILNSGGTATEMGLFVGGDMYGLSDEMPVEGLSDWQKNSISKFENLPGITIHELMHFQQNYQDRKNQETVMAAVIEEGVCDFFVELCSGKELDNENLEYLSDTENHDFIFDELQRDLFGTDYSKWVYNGGSIEDRPHDLGYTVGYLITRSYYQNHPDKKMAVEELLNTDDFTSIIRGSDYAYLLDDGQLPISAASE